MDGPGFTFLEWLRKKCITHSPSPAPCPREKGMTGRACWHWQLTAEDLEPNAGASVPLSKCSMADCLTASAERAGPWAGYCRAGSSCGSSSTHASSLQSQAHSLGPGRGS